MDERRRPVGIKIAEQHETYMAIPIGRSMCGRVLTEQSSGEASVSFRDTGCAWLPSRRTSELRPLP
jgi:hypothetical protein